MPKSMKERVSALLRKAENPAASEAEAQNCMNLAMSLMAKYGLSMHEITGDNAEEICGSSTKWKSGRCGDAMVYVQNSIAAFTSTRVSYRGNARTGTSMTYYGYEAERQLAIWLHNHISAAIQTESRRYNPPFRDARMRSRDRRSFALFMAQRISERLAVLTKKLDESGRGTGRDVIVAKDAKLDEFFDGLGIRNAPARKRELYSEGARAGRNAGDEVSLHRPVSSSSGPLRIAHCKGAA